MIDPCRYFFSPPWIFVMNVVDGMKTLSSKSCPVGDCPLRASTPTTWNGMLRMRTVWPTASALGPNSWSTTVWPSTATLVPPSMSDGPNVAPDAVGQLRTRK